MKKYVAIAPEGEYLDITPGKEYPVILSFGGHVGQYGRMFRIFDDTNHKLICNEFASSHLNGKNWTIKEVK
jgi:hypothetical protein